MSAESDDPTPPPNDLASRSVQVTEPFQRFWEEATTNSTFFATMLTLAVHSKDHAKLSIELDERTKKGENPISVLDDYFKNIPALSEYRQFVLEMLFCRIVDNFLTYISEIITLIYTQNPNKLANTEKIEPEILIRHDNISDLIFEVIELRVINLSHRGMKQLHKYLAQPDQLHFGLFPKKRNLEHASMLVEFRNLITHNRGMANRPFLRKVPQVKRSPEAEQIRAGAKLSLSGKDLYEPQVFFLDAAVDIDSRASEKFGLPRPVQVTFDKNSLERT